MKTIKRYANRKLYDPDDGRYVTLDDIAAMIRNNEEVRVIDYRTGADLTSVTLFQIIFEQEKAIGGMMPERVLTQVIGAGTTAVSSLKTSFRAFMEPIQHVDEEISRRLDLLVRKNLLTAEEKNRLEKMLCDPALSAAPTEPTPAAQPAPEKVNAMLREVEELEQQLEALRKGQSSGAAADQPPV
jgi:polyhydroxyalkanoate synthesis repressor PhaR